ncbi:MAG TPA: hypothetical protein VHX39_32610 [Acetobacteraceae bacterium]|jgi:hypothetical protein|nr:hypothetical protein [Acetobacteraceae bacterium]
MKGLDRRFAAGVRIPLILIIPFRPIVITVSGDRDHAVHSA